MALDFSVCQCWSQGCPPGQSPPSFLNGRLDLTRAEAVLQAIEAKPEERIARAGLEGQVSSVDSLEKVLRKES